MGCFKRTASKHIYYQGWNRSPAQVGCMRQALGPGALGRPGGSGWRGRWEGGSGWGRNVNSRTFHFNVWQNTLQIKKKKYSKKKFISDCKKKRKKKNWSSLVAQKLKHLRATRLNLQGNTTQKTFCLEQCKHLSGFRHTIPYTVSTATVHHSCKATKKRENHKNHLTVRLNGNTAVSPLGLLLHEPC